MKEIDYEHLMRMALQCGRSYEKGADADLYRRLERSAILFNQATEAKASNQTSTWGKPLSELEHDYQSRLYGVSNNVSRAIAIVLRQHSFTNEQRQKMEEYLKKLARPTFEELDEIIEEAQDIMIEVGIKFPS